MNTLDNLYEECFVINENAQIDDYVHLMHIKNIFDKPDLVLSFQNLLSKWESCNSSKPGVMSLQLPYWTANDIQKELFDFECIPSRSTTEFIYFYWDNKCMEANENDLKSNNCLLPHTDASPDKNCLILLVNLNKRPVNTGFWKFKGNSICESMEQSNEYYEYANKITEENLEEMTNNGILDKECEVEYHFNDAIIYPASRYHQPIIDKFYTRENPRILLRYCYFMS